jgi:hypothetical protein
MKREHLVGVFACDSGPGLRGRSHRPLEEAGP